jgi:hypothetical protein
MTEAPTSRASARFIAFLRSRPQPAIVSPDEIARATGISETDQIAIRQTLMLAGLLRLAVQDGRWAYALAGGAV